jgi:hypothetical protein
MWGQWSGTNPVWTNSNVGIGTANPVSNNGGVGRVLDVSASGATNSVVVLESGGTSGSSTGGILEARNTSATSGDPRLGELYWVRGADVTPGRLSSYFDLWMNNDGSLFSALRVMPNGNVGIGTTNPQYKLAVNGNIGAQDIIVTNTGWSDYVFQPGYRLRPLREIGAFIQANHHLPDIPSESEVKEKGVSLGDMQVKLLAKVEELTLHMIQADERNNRLEEQNQELRERLARLEKGAASVTITAAK